MSKTTLTPAQTACVDFPADRDLIVLGVAGSGKSLVVLHRAIQLARKARKADVPISIGLFTFINTLVDYTREVLEREFPDGHSGITASTLDTAIHNMHKALFPKSVGKRGKCYKTYDHLRILAEVVSALPAPEEKSRQTILSAERRTWLSEELAWMKQHLFTEREAYEACVRKGRGRVPLRREDRSFVWKIFEAYYRTLEEKGFTTIDVMCEEILRERDRIPDGLRFDIVLLDEAQDLPLNKLLVARELARDSITVAADFAQRIYRTSFTWKEVGIDIRGNGSKKLRGTHRNTRQIALLASKLQAHNTEEYDDDELTKLELPKREGELPRLLLVNSVEAENKALVELIGRIRDDYPEASIGIPFRTVQAGCEIEKVLQDAEIPYESVNKNCEYSVLSPGVKLVTYHSAKGLEFDQVILTRLWDEYFPKVEKDASEEAQEDLLNEARNLLYVGMTRAKTMLYMIASQGNGHLRTRLLNELDSDLMKTQNLT